MIKTSLSRGRQHYSRLIRARKLSSRHALPVSDGNVIYGLIGVNACVFGAWHMAETDYRQLRMMDKHFLLSYNNFWREGRLHTLITSVFSHQSFGHFAGNMLTLYFFGSSAIAILGARHFLTLYFGGGLFSSLCTVTWPDLIPSSWPASWQRSRYAPALGASGAVSAVVTWSILNHPTSIIMLYMIIPVPAALFGVLYIGNEVRGLYRGGTGTANIAHLGGVAFGGAYFFRNFRRFMRR